MAGVVMQGAIFDMDGVLVDNVAHHTRAWQQLGLELGRKFAEEDVRRVFGRRNREIVTALMGEQPLSPEEASRHARRKEELYRELMAAELAPVPGLSEFLADLKSLDFRTAVATSGPLDNVELVLNGLKLKPYFDTIVTGVEVPQSKPSPDIFLLAARRLDLPPTACVVFEDSAAGIEAARRAGCSCIGVATTHRPEEIIKFGPNHVVQDFTELRAIDIRNLSSQGMICRG